MKCTFYIIKWYKGVRNIFTADFMPKQKWIKRLLDKWKDIITKVKSNSIKYLLINTTQHMQRMLLVVFSWFSWFAGNKINLDVYLDFHTIMFAKSVRNIIPETELNARVEFAYYSIQ